MGNYGSIQVGGGGSDRQAAGNRRFPLFRRNDATGKDERVTEFADSDQLQEAMEMVNEKTGRTYYEESAAFRISVEEIVANSPALFAAPTLARRNPIPTDTEMLQGLREDAIRQRYHELVDKAGGNDAIAKYQLAEFIMNATSEEDQAPILEMARLTQPEGHSPYEDELRARKAAGLGPVSWQDNMHDEAAAQAYEQQKTNEALAFLEREQAGADADFTEEVA